MKKIFLIFTMASLCFAIPLDMLKSKLDGDLKQGIQIVSTTKSIDEKSKELFEIFDVYFDYPLMARIALGKNLYEKLNQQQKQEFQDSFIKRLKFSFSEKLNLYTNQQISLTNEERPNPKRYFIHSEIKNQNGEVYKIVFKFHQAKDDDYLLYDIDMLGVSLVQTYKAQFDDLKDADFNVILERLNAKNSLDDK